MNGTEVVLALITFMTVTVGGFFKLFADQNKTHTKLGSSLDRLAQAHEAGNKEAEERNGHLAELVIKTAERTEKTLKTLKKQQVKEQTVEHQTVKKW